jgi:RNA polymerase sigma-70 factor, ECF subfamily
VPKLGNTPMNAPPEPHAANDELYERFVPLFVAHEARLRSFLRALLPRWEQVDDVMQETSLVAWRKFAHFEPNSNFMAWVAAIARFEALRHLRDRGRDRLTFSPDLLEYIAADALEHTDTLARERVALDRCLDTLQAGQKELLEIAYQPGVRFRQVAAEAGRSVEGCYKTIQRLRIRLLECIQRQLKEEAT